MTPLAQAVARYNYAAGYDYLNSLAYELGRVGRLNEANRLSRFVVGSPLASAYDEWWDTRVELEEKTKGPSRSFVSVEQAPLINVFPLTPRSYRPEQRPRIIEEPGKVIIFPSGRVMVWSKEMVRKSAQQKPASKPADLTEMKKEIIHTLLDVDDPDTLEAVLESLRNAAETAVKGRENAENPS